MLPTGGNNPPGVTRSERYLAQLCERSFLSLWSHPNLYRDRAKELADLVVIFGEHVVIFSDKSCRFDESSPHGWSRWYRKSIAESTKQLFRAEGWIRKQRDRVFLDSKCERRFPFELPATPRVHLVAVALGAAEACRKHFDGGSGSLALEPASDGTKPFVLGDVDKGKPFIHVFDDVSLDLVLQELDTVDDFVRYLDRKELLARSGQLLGAHGEEDLLAYYLTHIGPDGRHDFVVPDHADGIIIAEHWDAYVGSAEYATKKKADKVSYLWDEIIEWIAGHAIGGTLVLGGEHPLSKHEEALRFLASEPRLARRGLSLAISDMFARSNAQDLFARTVPSQEPERHSYLFLTLARSTDSTEEKYRETRQHVLQAYCETVKLRIPGLQRLVGLAFGAERDNDKSIDSIVIRFDKWTDADVARAQEVRRRMEWSDGTDLPRFEGKVLEYPDPPLRPSERGPGQPRRDVDNARKAKRKAQRAARKKSRR